MGDTDRPLGPVSMEALRLMGDRQARSRSDAAAWAPLLCSQTHNAVGQLLARGFVRHNDFGGNWASRRFVITDEGLAFLAAHIGGGGRP